MCLALPSPPTDGSGAQGLWGEYTAKPQPAAPKGSTFPLCFFGRGGNKNVTTSASFQKAGRQGTSTEPHPMPTQPPPGPWKSVGG